MKMTMMSGSGRGLVTSHSDSRLRVQGEDVEIQLSCDSLGQLRRHQLTTRPAPRLRTFHCLHPQPSPAASSSTSAESAAARAETPRIILSSTEQTNAHLCPDIVISCSLDSDDDDNDVGADVRRVDQLSSAFDYLVRQHARPGTTLDDVIGDVTKLRDVVDGDCGRTVNRELVAAECRQLAVDCQQLVASVFYRSTADVTVNANRALYSLSALVRHSHNVTYDVSAPVELVSNVMCVVGAFEATVTAAKEAVGGPDAGSVQLANFIRQASTLARCLQLLLTSIVDAKS